MNQSPSRRGALAVLAALCLLAAQAAPAQERPPVKLLVGFPAGGSTDALARLMADKLKPLLGQPVVVENRPGVAGRVATIAVKDAGPQDTVLMVAPNAIITQQLLYPATVLKYDLLTDLQPLAVIASYAQAMAVHPGTGVKNARQYIEWARADKSRGLFGNGGLGSESHFYGVELGRAAGVPLQVVPYRGNGPMVVDLLGGQVQAGIAASGDLVQHLQAGKLQAIGVFGERRSPLMPEVPTMLEQGFKVAGPEPWTGVWASAKLPRAEAQRLQNALREVLAMPDVRELLATRYVALADFRPGDEMDRMIRRELEHWGPVIKASGYKPE